MVLLFCNFHELYKKDAYVDTSSKNMNKIFYEMSKITPFNLAVNETANTVFHFWIFWTVLITLWIYLHMVPDMHWNCSY